MNEATMCTLKTLVIIFYKINYLHKSPSTPMLSHIAATSATSSVILIYTLYISSLYKLHLKLNFTLTTLILKTMEIMLIIILIRIMV